MCKNQYKVQIAMTNEHINVSKFLDYFCKNIKAERVSLSLFVLFTLVFYN